jgi:hypothetical protein
LIGELDPTHPFFEGNQLDKGALNYDPLDLKYRVRNYARLARWREQLDSFNDPSSEALLQTKTIETASHILSARCRSLYYNHVLEQVRSFGNLVAGAKTEIRDLRDAIVKEDATLTPNEYNVWIKRLTDLITNISNPNDPVRMELESLTKALQRDKDASGSASDAIHVFRDQFELDVDRLIRQYEEVILELAAYVPIKQIRDRVVNDDFTVTELQTVGQKFTSYDNEVKDATVRAAFMLPPIQ